MLSYFQNNLNHALKCIELDATNVELERKIEEYQEEMESRLALMEEKCSSLEKEKDELQHLLGSKAIKSEDLELNEDKQFSNLKKDIETQTINVRNESTNGTLSNVESQYLDLDNYVVKKNT